MVSREHLECDRLIARLQGGEISAFEELYLRYCDQVHDYLRAALKDDHEAEDATQQVFFDALKALPRYEIRADKPFRAWLFSIARNHVARHFRRQKPVHPEDPAVIDRRRENGENGGLETVLRGPGWLSDGKLRDLFESLPLPQRKTLFLHYVGDLTVEEIAAALGCTPVSVRQIRHRALRFLEARLSASGYRGTRVARDPMFVLRQPVQVLRARRFALGQDLHPLSSPLRGASCSRPRRW